MCNVILALAPDGQQVQPQPRHEWEQYVLTTLQAGGGGGERFTLDEVHDEILVPVVNQFRTRLAALDQAPANAVAVAPGAAGWAALAFKDHANANTDQTQWANPWWLQLSDDPNLYQGVPQQPNPRGQFFYVVADNGYIEQTADGHDPQAVTYAALLDRLGAPNQDRVWRWLAAMVRTPNEDPVPDRSDAVSRAVRQMASALMLAEVHRNNLTLPVNLAMLDLIAGGVFTINQFLGGLHPMAQGGPMAHIGPGTAGARAGAAQGTRTRALETSVVMYWLHLMDSRIRIEQNGEERTFNPAVEVSDLRPVAIRWDRNVNVVGRAAVTAMLQERLLRGLLTQNRLDYGA
jgi:hypothetical protein